MKYVLLFVFVALLAVVLPKAHAQPVTGVTYTNTGNLITPTVSGWQGTVAGSYQGFSGGSSPAYNAATDTVIFGYTTKTVKQIIGINTALQGTGIQVGGYNYSWTINNDAASGNYGTLTGNVALKASNGSTLNSYSYSYNSQNISWQTFSGTQWLPQEYPTSALSNLELSFTGKDARFWAGYYGPQVRSPQLSLAYRVDPCVTNPAYSVDCANYNQVLTSQTINAQSYAINQALNLSGSGVMLHGLDYGYSVTFGNQYCTGWFLICYSYGDSSASVAAVVTDNNSNTIYSRTETHSGADSTNNYSFNYRFPSSRAIGTLGGFAFGESTTGNATVSNYWSNWKYTPDPCVVNPLSSTSCSGYAEAYKTQQCSMNALYDPTCPGYAAAYFTQQCTANALYNASCPGYASAYLTYQCSINPLYSTTCSGYEAAYKTQQCSLNSLYATDCPGYAATYKTQQCNLDGLYAKDCPNYNEAYAKKNILGIGTTSTTSTTTTTTSTVSTTEPTPTISSTGKVTTEVAIVSDSNVNTVITSKSTSTDAAATTAPVNVTRQETPQTQQVQQTATSGKSEEKKDDAPKSTGGGSSSQNTGNSTASSDTKNQPKTARQEIAEKRQEAARAKAVEAGKNLANEMGKAASMEQQIAVQNVVIQAMAFTPGFDSYARGIVPDAAGYKPYTAYPNQRTVDNARLGRGLFGATDKLHNEMIDLQYNR